LLDHLGRDHTLAVERIGGHDAALERQQLQQLRHCRDLVGLAVHSQLAQQPPMLSRPGMKHVQRRLARSFVKRAAQRFAIDRHHAAQALGKALHEADKAGLERRGIKQPAQTKRFRREHAAEGVMAGNAMAQAKELTQARAKRCERERRLGVAKQPHVRAILASAQHGAERNQQDLMQVVADILLPRVADLGKTGDEIFHLTASTLTPILEIQDQPASQPLSQPHTPICDSPVRRQ